MKKKIMIAASIALIAGSAFLGVKKSVANKSGDLLMANVEAMADETGECVKETRYYAFRYDCLGADLKPNGKHRQTCSSFQACPNVGLSSCTEHGCE